MFKPSHILIEGSAPAVADYQKQIKFAEQILFNLYIMG